MLWKCNLKQFVNDTTTGQTHTYQKEVKEENVKMNIMKKRKKMNYEVHAESLGLGSSAALDLCSGNCVREGQANGVTMVVCVLVYVCVGMRHVWHAPRLQ